MVKMRYASNPRLATVAPFDRYIEWLKGPQVWNFVVKGKDGVPVACPHIGLVTEYDFAIRQRQAKLMNVGHDFQKAQEMAMADSDLRMQKFMGPFTCEVTTADCKALSAPGISDIFPQLQKGAKRSHFATIGGRPETPRASGVATESLSKGQAKRAKKAAAKKKVIEHGKTSVAEVRGQKKGKGKGGKDRAIGQGPPAAGTRPELPPGCVDRTDDGRQICFNFNKGTCTRGDSCRFVHVSWKKGAAAAPPPGAGVALG